MISFDNLKEAMEENNILKITSEFAEILSEVMDKTQITAPTVELIDRNKQIRDCCCLISDALVERVNSDKDTEIFEYFDRLNKLLV